MGVELSGSDVSAVPKPAEDTAKESARERRDPHPGLEKEFADIYKAEYPAALCFARGFVDEDTAEDVVQKVFLRYWEGYAETPALVFRADPPRVRKAILASVANELKMLRRRAAMLRRKAAYVRDDVVKTLHDSHSREPAGAELVLSEAVAHALDRLPVTLRTTFMLVRFDDMSYADAAELLGVSQETVHKRMSKANFRLRAMLLDYVVPEPDWAFIYRNEVRDGRKDAQP